MRSVIRKRDTRVRRSIDMVWSMDELGFAGHGTIVDLSVGGARIQLNRSLPVPLGAYVSIVSDELPNLPTLARVRWVRRTMAITQCGIEFGSTDPRWDDWVADQSAA